MKDVRLKWDSALGDCQIETARRHGPFKQTKRGRHTTVQVYLFTYILFSPNARPLTWILSPPLRSYFYSASQNYFTMSIFAKLQLAIWSIRAPARTIKQPSKRDKTKRKISTTPPLTSKSHESKLLAATLVNHRQVRRQLPGEEGPVGTPQLDDHDNTVTIHSGDLGRARA